MFRRHIEFVETKGSKAGDPVGLRHVGTNLRSDTAGQRQRSA